MSDSLYDRPDLYDLMHPPDPAMERFYIEEALKGGRQVLELACGSGRFTVPMALAGATVVGGDLSWAMLYRARTRRRNAGRRSSSSSSTCATSTSAGSSTPIVVAANSILHLHTADDFTGFFRSVRRHLAPMAGWSSMRSFRALTMLSRDPKERHFVERMERPSGGPVTLEETTRYDPLTQISHIDWYWSTEGRARLLAHQSSRCARSSPRRCRCCSRRAAFASPNATAISTAAR